MGSGFDNDVMYAENVDFTGGSPVSGKVTTDGQLLIGSSVTPNIRVATLTAGSGVAIANGNGTITLSAGATVATTYATDSGNATPALNTLNVLGGTNGPNIVTSGSGNTVTIRADIITYTDPGAYPYTALSTDYYISVTTTAAARTINLPNAPTTRKSYVVKDRVGNAAANNISVTTPGGAVTFDGSTTYTINSNYGSAKFVFNGTSYEVF